jgi:hypothetical protein
LCGYFAPKRIRIDVVDKGTLTVDLHDGEPFPVLRLERRVATDVELLEAEGHLLADRLDDCAGTLAEVTTLREVQNDLPQGLRGKSRAL